MDVIICSRKKELFKGRADSLYLPAKEGDFEILPGHAPLLALLDKGQIRLRANREEKAFSIESGFIEVHNHEVSLLVKES